MNAVQQPLYIANSVEALKLCKLDKIGNSNLSYSIGYVDDEWSQIMRVKYNYETEEEDEIALFALEKEQRKA